MTGREVDTLGRYARVFARTEDDADELLLLAYMESLRLGPKCALALLVNYMRLCSRSIKERSILSLDEAGKSRLDAFNKKRSYLSDPVARGCSGDNLTLETVIASDSVNPFDDYVSNEFIGSLDDREKKVLSELMEGYSVREICSHMRISSKTFEKYRGSLREKARSILF